MTTVGTGRYVYESVENWARLPAGWTLGQTGIVTDSQDRVYLFNRGDHPLIVLDREGNYLASWGEGVLTDAHGMFIDAQDNLYLPVKNNHVVLKYSKDGNLLMTLGTRDQPSDTGWVENYTWTLRDDGVWFLMCDLAVRAAGPFHRPTDVGLDPQGDLYVSDGYGNARVHKFSGSGELLFSWGAPGKSAPSEFHVPHGIWVHTDGRVFVADRENNRIQIFSSDGQFLDQWTDFARPCDIYIDADEVMYVAELDSFVSIVTIEGDLLGRWDKPNNAGHGEGAHALWVDSHGDLYVNQNLEGHRLIKYCRNA